MEPYQKFYYYMYHFPSLDSINFLRGAFKEYFYGEKRIYTDQLKRREIGFIPFNGTMTRHMLLKDKAELDRFLTETVPRHLYHSLAFYDDPANRSMQAKVWRGAEFVFDLDADHIENAANMSYEEILAEVKKHTERLINKFLMGYLSLDADSLKLLFSGGRGYHIHINNESYYSMNSDQRREISNLVRGEGITTENFLQMMKTAHLIGMGWFSEIDFAFRKEILNILDRHSSDIIEKEKSEDLQATLNEKLKSKNFKTKAEAYRRAAEGSVIYRYINRLEREILDHIVDQAQKNNACEIDEPVSTDIHRLIRFPYSLHGKTGLVVKPIKLDNLKDFIPLVDGVHNFGKELVTIVLPKKFKINFQDSEYDMEGRVEVPYPLAVFMVSSGRAKLE